MSQGPSPSQIAALAGELADPTRVRVLETLLTEGPQAAAELSDRLDLAPSRLANHLKRLRGAGLIRVEREGRCAIYLLAAPTIGEAIAGLRLAATGGPQQPARAAPPRSPLAEARRCYDHLAGRLGVGVTTWLTRRQALQPCEGPRAAIPLGPAATEVFSELGVDLQQMRCRRRRYAFGCLDWTERRPHLAGGLGAAVFAALQDSGWVISERETRVVRVTELGRQQLAPVLEESGTGAEPAGSDGVG